MPPQLAIKLTQGKISSRIHNTIARAVLHSVAQHHLAFNVPLRFENNPSTAVGGPLHFKRRSKKWTAIKSRRGGEVRPNVDTGAMRLSVLGSSRITATATRARLYLKPGHPIHQFQRDELEAITPGELRSLINLGNRLYADEVKKIGREAGETVTI